jgi:hypothetical protein
MGDGKTRSFSPDSPWPPFLFLSFVFLCFRLAFGALRAPSSFDLGQKEIENWTFCVSAAVYLIITANNDTDCIEPLGPHVSFESSTPGLTSASSLHHIVYNERIESGLAVIHGFLEEPRACRVVTEPTSYH